MSFCAHQPEMWLSVLLMIEFKFSGMISHASLDGLIYQIAVMTEAQFLQFGILCVASLADVLVLFLQFSLLCCAIKSIKCLLVVKLLFSIGRDMMMLKMMMSMFLFISTSTCRTSAWYSFSLQDRLTCKQVSCRLLVFNLVN